MSFHNENAWALTRLTAPHLLVSILKMQLALAESPACHSPFQNIFCDTPNPMICGYLQTGITINVTPPLSHQPLCNCMIKVLLPIPLWIGNRILLCHTFEHENEFTNQLGNSCKSILWWSFKLICIILLCYELMSSLKSDRRTDRRTDRQKATHKSPPCNKHRWAQKLGDNVLGSVQPSVRVRWLIANRGSLQTDFIEDLTLV